MKKYIKFLVSAITVSSLAFTFTSCSSDDPDPTATVQINLADCDVTFGPDFVWTGWDKDQSLVLRGFIFSHTVTEWGSFQGFVPAVLSTNAKPVSGAWYESTAQFEVMPRGGAAGVATPYMIGYWNTMETDETPLAERSCVITYSGIGASVAFTPISVRVTNTAYDYYSMAEGDNFARKFEKGDRLRLIAHGVKENGKETTTSFDLANVTDNNDTAAGIVSDWQMFNLTPLGEVVAVYFTMESTDSGQWGMNTPSYFGLDMFTAQMNNY